MKKINIGRSNTNDCVFTNPSVSKQHAVLTIDSNEQYGILRDLGSTNGTFVNGNRIKTDTKVSYADKIRLGSEETTLAGILEKANKTIMKVIPGIDQRTIGKSPENQIVLNYSDVSRKHAILYKDSNGNIVIEDTNSTNGTYVNGVRITSQVLHHGDKVTITRNYPLNWETVFPTNKPFAKHKISWGKPAIAVVAVLLICIIGYWSWQNLFWNEEKIYKEYNSAVCLTFIGYGYRVLIDGQDMTSSIFKSDLVSINNNGDIVGGVAYSEGTSFFISEDGKLATNLHLSRPWLFEDNAEHIKQAINTRLSILEIKFPLLVNRSEVKVEGVMSYIYIQPNGLPVSEENWVECKEIRGYDDINKDVAILQTMNHKLPDEVKKIIDINKADMSEDAIKEGKTIYTIGFPYGTGRAMNSNQEMVNQIQSGKITQNRGDYEFGHNAATAGGASGSPILNKKGRLIGVHHAGMTGATGAQGFNSAIKVKYLRELLDK